MKLNIAVCDDNREELENESELLESVLKEMGVEYEISIFNSPENLANSTEEYNLLILDIEMEKMNGIKIAEKARLKNKECLIFFVTNYENYIDEALNQHAFRFWTKPMDRHRIIYGMESVIKELRAFEHYIAVIFNKEKIQIKSKNIVYIYIQQRKLHIVTVNGEIITNDTFENILMQIGDNPDFYSPHRSYLVNFRYIKNYDKSKIYCECSGKNYEVYLSRRKYEEFKKAFLCWVGEN